MAGAPPLPGDGGPPVDGGPATGAGAGRRAAALDRLRGVALAAMLLHHLVDWQTGDARSVLPGWRAFALTDAAAVAFFVASGASMALFAGGRRARGGSRRRVGAQVLRRYGLLVPIGLALDWLLWRDPLMCGVLEVLGVTVVAGGAICAVVPQRLLPGVAVALLGTGMWAERAVEGRTDWWSAELIGGKFPVVTYLGFVLLGIAAVRTGWYLRRRAVAVAAAVASLLTAAVVVGGMVPARYPGDLRFVVPATAITLVVYALAQAPWGHALARVDRALRRSAAHTLGLFLAHYGAYAGLRRAGLLGDVPPAVAVPAAAATTVMLCVVAPHVPQPAWSVRTGRRRPRPHPAYPASGVSRRAIAP